MRKNFGGGHRNIGVKHHIPRLRYFTHRQVFADTLGKSRPPKYKHWHIGPQRQTYRLEVGLARLAALTTLKEVNRVPLLLAQVQLAKEQGNKQRARALLNQGLKTYPSTPEWRYERGLLNDDLGDTEAAIADLRLSLKLQPNTPQGLNALGYVLANHNRQLPEARRLVSRALKLEPNNPMLLDSMGWVEFRQGQFNAALGYLQRAYQLLPDAEIAAHLGEVLWVLGRQAEALVVWDKAIEAGDASGLVRRTQTRLQPAVQP